MPMDNLSVLTIDFADMYEHFAQQMEARLAGVVKNDDFTGEFMTDDYINTLPTSEFILNRATAAATDTSKNMAFTRRRCTAGTFTYPVYKAEKDIVKMMKDPESEMVKEIVNAFNRYCDDLLIAAALGNADTYNQGTGLWEQTPLPAGMKIAAGATNLTVEKLIEAAELLNAQEVPEEGRKIAVGSKQIASLLADEKVTSADFNTVKALVNGSINTYMGFEFIRIERLPLNTTVRSCFAFHPQHLLFGTNMSRRINIAKDPAHNFDYLIHVEEQAGALRRTDQGTVQIDCDEA